MEFDPLRSIFDLSAFLPEAESILQQFQQVNAVLQEMRKWHQSKTEDWEYFFSTRGMTAGKEPLLLDPSTPPESES